MRTYIFVNFVVNCILILGAFAYLAVGDYPRKVERSRSYDVVVIISGLGWLAWQILLLFGRHS